MSLKVGITGGIGSGKSTVCKVFETLGIPVYYADERAKYLMNNNGKLVEAIKRLLGEQAYNTKTGLLDRGYVGTVVFGDEKKLTALNQLVHPAVYQDTAKWQELNKQSPYTLKEAAILFESGGHHFVDKTITVTAPKSVRLERVMNRDGVDEAAVMARMDKQMPDEEKRALADFVIYNDGSTMIIPQVLEVHRQLLDLATFQRN